MVLHDIFVLACTEARQAEPDDEEGPTDLLLHPLLGFPKLPQLRCAGCRPSGAVSISAGWQLLLCLKRSNRQLLPQHLMWRRRAAGEKCSAAEELTS